MRGWWVPGVMVYGVTVRCLVVHRGMGPGDSTVPLLRVPPLTDPGYHSEHLLAPFWTLLDPVSACFGSLFRDFTEFPGILLNFHEFSVIFMNFPVFY